MAWSDGKSADMAPTERAVIRATPRSPARAAATATRPRERAWIRDALRMEVMPSPTTRPLNWLAESGKSFCTVSRAVPMNRPAAAESLRRMSSWGVKSAIWAPYFS